jgi:hypothetical protein
MQHLENTHLSAINKCSLKAHKLIITTSIPLYLYIQLQNDSTAFLMNTQTSIRMSPNEFK